MHFVIGIAVLCLNLIILYKDFAKGLMLYFILSFLIPNIHIYDLILTYELFAFVPIFILFIIVRKDICFNKTHHLLYLYLIIILFSSVISINLYRSNINWVSFFGLIRFVLKLIMLSQIKINFKLYFEKTLLVVISLNTLISIIQISSPKTVNLFYTFYYRPSLTPLKEVLNVGKFNRAYGTFGTPVNLGGVALIAFSYFLVRIVEKRYEGKHIIGLVSSLITGLLSLTKTFILGVPIITIITILLSYYFTNNDSKTSEQAIVGSIKKVFLVMLMIFVGKLAINKMDELGLPVSYYLKYLNRPLHAFTSRYDSTKGILSLTKQVIRENILIGVGVTNIAGEFIGDSAYIVILHSSGLIGAMLFSFIFLLLLRNAITQKDFSKIMVFISLLMVGLSQPVFISNLGCIIISFCYSEKENYKCNIKNKRSFELKI